MGTAAIQLGRAAGARVTATVRREELRAEVEQLGARAIAPEGFEDEGPFDVILELVGAPNIPGNLKALAALGRIVVIGVGAGCEGRAASRRPDGQARPAQRVARFADPSLEEKAIAMRLVERRRCCRCSRPAR